MEEHDEAPMQDAVDASEAAPSAPSPQDELAAYITSLHARIDMLEAEFAQARQNADTLMNVISGLGERCNYRLTKHQITGGRVRLDWNPTGRIVV